MLLVHLDPGLLAVPNYASDQDELEKVISRIEHWSHRSTLRQINLTRAADCDQVLAELGLFPAQPGISEVLEFFDLSYAYSAADIARLINGLLDRSSVLLDAANAEIVDLSEFEIEPDPLLSLSPQSLKGSSQRAAANAAWMTGDDAVPAVTVLAGGFCCDDKAFAIDASGLLLWRREPENNVEDIAFSSDLCVIAELDDLVEQVSASVFWNLARTPKEFHFAIALAALEISVSAGRKRFEDLPAFAVGSDFGPSLAQNQAGQNQPYSNNVLECCARILLNSPKYEIGKLTNKLGQQISRDDGALAGRSHVSKAGAALRLMTWHVGLDIEFANVGVKQELKIEDGLGPGRFEGDFKLI